MTDVTKLSIPQLVALLYANACTDDVLHRRLAVELFQHRGVRIKLDDEHQTSYLDLSDENNETVHTLISSNAPTD